MSEISSSLRFAPDILRRLGEELIPNPEQGIIELVKNSYDADSKECTVSLTNVAEAGGSITIEDKGIGMLKSDLLDGFLIIGSSRKVANSRTKIYDRLPVGDKGLGRLAALRLGFQVIVRSRPKALPGIEFTLKLDWNLIDCAKVVEEIPIYIEEGATNKSEGVTIEILDLRQPLKKDVVTRLAHELLLLADPFKEDTGFRVELLSPEFKNLETIVKESYFEDADFILTAHIDDNGVGKATLIDGNKNILNEEVFPLKNKRTYDIPALTFNLWIYIFGQNFTSKKSSTTQVKNWIKYSGGVHFYHRKLRVRPYGDPGSDWLDMNLSRVSHPEFRPSTNTVIGRITTEDSTPRLKQPTNRIGFVEDNTFNDIKRFAQDVIRWAADYRLKEAEKEREKKKQEAKRKSEIALEEVRSIIRATVPKESVKQVEKAFNNFTKAQEKEVLSLREDLQLYRSLATAGTTSAVFAHEAAKPITMINTIADTIERRSKKQLGDIIYLSTLSEPVLRLKRISSSLNVYSQFPIYHLRKAKRISGPLKINKIWHDIAYLFKPLLEQAKIGLDILFEEDDIEITGSIALVEAIATNLITNSIYALTNTNATMKGRMIKITGSSNSDIVKIIHADNGPGIKIDVDSIWLPGTTTNPEGTGFGLTIARDSILDLKGNIKAVANGILGGAEFTLEFPLYKQRTDV